MTRKASCVIPSLSRDLSIHIAPASSRACRGISLYISPPCHPEPVEGSEPKALKAVCSPPKQHRLHMANIWNGSDPFDSPPFLLGGSLRVTQKEATAPPCGRFRSGGQKRKVPSFNNLLRVRKPCFSESAPSSEQSAALSLCPSEQSSHACSAPPLPKNLGHCPAIFGSPVAENLRLLGKGVNVRDFYNPLAKAKTTLFAFAPCTARAV